MKPVPAILAAALAALAAGCDRDADTESRLWERSVISIRATRQKYDYSQPWSRETSNIDKVGVVIDKDTILTTADHLGDRTLITVRREGRGKWWPARVEWIDYHANLALIGSAEAGFWSGLQPARMASRAPESGPVFVRRWREGRLEAAKGEITDVIARRSQLSHTFQLALEIQADIDGAGWSEVVTRGSEVLGITSSAYDKSINAIPAPFIDTIIKTVRSGDYRGAGLFTFEWQQGRNPDTLAFLRAPASDNGVVVTRVPRHPQPETLLRPRDVILAIDGFPISPEGDYRDPRFGFLDIEFLADRGRSAGDGIPMTIVRDGKQMNIDYKLPAASFDVDLVPLETFDQPPEYLIVGGLVFQPLTEPLLRSLGRAAPFRLGCYRQDLATDERPSVVFLSQVLPDPVNIDYHDSRHLVLERVNGRPIRVLKDVADAVHSPMGDVHLFEFVPGSGLQRIVIDARKLDQADQRILKRYGIPASAALNQPVK